MSNPQAVDVPSEIRVEDVEFCLRRLMQWEQECRFNAKKFTDRRLFYSGKAEAYQQAIETIVAVCGVSETTTGGGD